MSKMIEALRGWGCDMDGAMARFMDDEEMYLMFIPKMIDEPAYAKLGEALKKGDAKEGFEQAHLLKGVLANMGLTPILNAVILLVEPLRAGKVEGLTEYYDELLAQNNKLRELYAANK